MTVAEAIKRQKEFIADKHHIFRYSNNELKESMKVLTKAYDDLWNYLDEKEPETLDNFIKYLIDKDNKEIKMKHIIEENYNHIPRID